jgi:prepilin-type N-terminal cleavage/methylation domain-containing protein
MNGLHYKATDDQSGFAIVELLITLIIIGVAFGAFMVTFTTIQSINKKAQDISKANTLSFAKVQEYENKNYTTLPATAPIGTLQEVEDFSASLPTTMQSPRVGKVYINTISATLKQVVVTIEFGSGDTKRIVQYGDFIQRHGLGR